MSVFPLVSISIRLNFLSNIALLRPYQIRAYTVSECKFSALHLLTAIGIIALMLRAIVLFILLDSPIKHKQFFLEYSLFVSANTSLINSFLLMPLRLSVLSTFLFAVRLSFIHHRVKLVDAQVIQFSP